MGNVVLPPVPANESVRARMRAQQVRDTTPEMALRRALHRRGLRYRVAARVVPGDRRRSVDVAFGPARVAVFVDGCFWHSCPMHGSSPRNNADWWRDKLARNAARDAETTARLTGDGWLVIRVWEHEDPETAADRVASAVAARRRP